MFQKVDPGEIFREGNWNRKELDFWEISTNTELSLVNSLRLLKKTCSLRLQFPLWISPQDQEAALASKIMDTLVSRLFLHNYYGSKSTVNPPPCDHENIHQFDCSRPSKVVFHTDECPLQFSICPVDDCKKHLGHLYPNHNLWFCQLIPKRINITKRPWQIDKTSHLCHMAHACISVASFHELCLPTKLPEGPRMEPMGWFWLSRFEMRRKQLFCYTHTGWPILRQNYLVCLAT